MVDNKLNTGSKRKKHLIEEKKEKTEKIVAKVSTEKDGQPPAKKMKKPKNPSGIEDADKGVKDEAALNGAENTGKLAKRRKGRKAAPKEKVKNNEKSEALQKQLQEQAHEYLKAWKNDRKSWKFRKNLQTWLIVNIFDMEKVPSEQFDILLEYFKGAQGSVHKHLTKYSITRAHAIRTNPNPNPEDAEANQETLVRSRRLIKLLTSLPSEVKAEKENSNNNVKIEAGTETGGEKTKRRRKRKDGKISRNNRLNIDKAAPVAAEPPKAIKEEVNGTRENAPVTKKAAEKVVSFMDEATIQPGVPAKKKKAKKVQKLAGILTEGEKAPVKKKAQKLISSSSEESAPAKATKKAPKKNVGTGKATVGKKLQSKSKKALK